MRAGDAQPVRLDVPLGISVHCGHGDEHMRTGRDRLRADLNLLQCASGGREGRRLEPEHLLHGALDQRRFLAELGALVRMAQHRRDRQGDQAHRRLEPGRDQEERVCQELTVVEHIARPVCTDYCREHVVSGLRPSPRHHFCRVLHQLVHHVHGARSGGTARADDRHHPPVHSSASTPKSRRTASAGGTGNARSSTTSAR